MKRLFTIGFFSIISLISFAQKELLILTNERTIGKKIKTNNEIIAKEFIFPERIDNSYIDTLTNCLTVQLRGTSKNGKWLNNTGNIVLYDLAKKSMKWAKKTNYQQGSIEQFDNVIIQTLGNNSYCLNIDNGENIWEVKNNLYYVEPFKKVGIGYRIEFGDNYTNTLEGIDLTDGNSIWEREINREFSWNSIFHLNDSTIIVVAAGLHSINLKSGKGWDFDAITGKKDYSATVAANAAGVALGILTGTFVMSTGHNLVRDVVSNVLVDSSNIYFASKENITRLNHNGQVLWSYPLPKDFTSKSTILKKDSLLYMINKGYAFMGYRQLDFGTPFIAAFNINSGKQVFLSTINGKENQINGFDIKKDTIFLVFKESISKYSMIDGTIISEKTIHSEKLGELMYFIGEQVYINVDSTFKSLELSDPTKHFLYTKSGKTLVINDKLEIINEIDYDKLFIYYLKTKNLKFIAKINETTVIDNEGNKVAELNVSRNAFLLGTKLYDIQERSFFEIEISELTNY